jgi:hypothetical protein
LNFENLLASFVFSVQPTKGLLGTILDLHERNERNTLMIIYFILKVASEHQPVFEYLLKRKSRLHWIKEYLESKIEDEQQQVSTFCSQIERKKTMKFDSVCFHVVVITCMM